jgi:segregation and condensation protein B
VTQNINDPDAQGSDARAQTARHLQAVAAALPNNVTVLPGSDRGQHMRMLEAMLFAAAEPLDEASLAARLPQGVDVAALLRDLEAAHARRGVNLVQVAGKWSFRTAEDLAFLMRREAHEQKRLSRAALETLAIIAYHQPVTRADIEDIRGVAVNKGTIDVLMEAGWIKIRGRRHTPGRPVTFGTTDGFLSHFGLNSVKDLPGVEELKAAGLLSSEVPDEFEVGSGEDEGEDPFVEAPELVFAEEDEALIEDDGDYPPPLG